MCAGNLSRNRAIRVTLTYVWQLFGFLLPVMVLVVCNVLLTRVLLRSNSFWEKSASSSRRTGRFHSCSVSAQLVIAVALYVLLVSPSECLRIYEDLAHHSTFRTFELAIMLTNVMQAVGFSFHFVLYCVFSRPYRKIIKHACRLAAKGLSCSTVKATSHATTMTRWQDRKRHQIKTADGDRQNKVQIDDDVVGELLKHRPHLHLMKSSIELRVN